jgi:hypothetical protein
MVARGENQRHFCGIVVSEVHARSNADFQNRPRRQWDDLLANLLDGLWVSEDCYDVGVDPVSVEDMIASRVCSKLDQTKFAAATSVCSSNFLPNVVACP